MPKSIVFPCFILLSLAAGCSVKSDYPVEIELPSTPVLSLGANWAVVTSSHLRLREQPGVDSAVIATLWRGYILEIISKQNTQVEIEGIDNYWHRVQYGGLQGWVFGGYLEFYETRDAAKDAAHESRQ